MHSVKDSAKSAMWTISQGGFAVFWKSPRDREEMHVFTAVEKDIASSGLRLRLDEVVPQEDRMTNLLGYSCDYCGACCTKLLVEADALDALREPRLLEVPGPQPSLQQLLENEDMVIILAGQAPCTFLRSENETKHLCSIYPTRPNVCVEMLAGDAKCQQAISRPSRSSTHRPAHD
jgi:Fe-S-cluster containining protein